MTLPRLEAIVKHWDKVPPLSVSVAQLATYFGVSKPASKVPAKRSAEPHQAAQQEQDFGPLISLFGGGSPGLKIVGGTAHG